MPTGMNYNYATKDSGLYEEALVQGILTAPLESRNLNWYDARTFRVSSLTTSGYQYHTRNKGYNPGTLANPDSLFELNFDRDIEFYVDRADVDETNQALSVARISERFMATQARPEVDAYRFMKLCDFATASGQTATETLTTATVYPRLKAMIAPLRKYNPQNTILYVSSEVMDMLEQSEAFTRIIMMQEIAGTNLNSRVTAIDGVQIIEVWDTSRFYNSFDFTDGFVPTPATPTPPGPALAINAIAVSVPSILAAVKFESIFFFAPGQHTQGDGYLYQNRLYHDIFILPDRADGVVTSLRTA